MTDLRDTNYATEIARAVREFPDGSEARLERLHVKSRQAEEIRFSWWKTPERARFQRWIPTWK